MAWIDDDVNDGGHDWARSRSGPTLLVDTEPAIGLTPEHVERLLAWAPLPAPIKPAG